MMNEEDELDDELHKLGIKEDSGEDSDITPTNSPLTPPTVIQLPQSSNTSGFFEGDCTRSVVLKLQKTKFSFIYIKKIYF